MVIHLGNPGLMILSARYPLRESGVFGAIAEALRCSERRDYEQMVVSQIRRDSDLAQKLRERIAPLSTALEAEPIRQPRSATGGKLRIAAAEPV